MFIYIFIYIYTYIYKNIYRYIYPVQAYAIQLHVNNIHGAELQWLVFTPETRRIEFTLPVKSGAFGIISQTAPYQANCRNKTAKRGSIVGSFDRSIGRSVIAFSATLESFFVDNGPRRN